MKIVLNIREVVLLMLFISMPYLSMEDKNKNLGQNQDLRPLDSSIGSQKKKNPNLNLYQYSLFENPEPIATHPDTRSFFELNGRNRMEDDEQWDLEDYIKIKNLYDQRKIAMGKASMDKKCELPSSDQPITSLIVHYLQTHKTSPQNNPGVNDNIAYYLSTEQAKRFGYPEKVPNQSEVASPIKPGFVKPLTAPKDLIMESPKKSGFVLETTQNSAFSKVKSEVPSPIKSEVKLETMAPPIKPGFVRQLFGQQMESSKKSEATPPMKSVFAVPDIPVQRKLFEKTKVITKLKELKCRCAELLMEEQSRRKNKFDLNKKTMGMYLVNQQSSLANKMHSEKNKYSYLNKPDCILKAEESGFDDEIHFLDYPSDKIKFLSNRLIAEYDDNTFNL